MPATTTPYRTSGLSERCFQEPSTPWCRAVTPSICGQQGQIPRVNERIDVARNSAQTRVVPDRKRTQQRTVSSLPFGATYPKPRAFADPTANKVTLCVQPLSDKATRSTKQAAVLTSLMSVAAVSSHYWRHTLKGGALCVLHRDGSVLCRVSSQADGGADRKDSDAWVVLRSDKALLGKDRRAFQAGVSVGPGVETFCHATAQAARWRFNPLAKTTAEGYRDVITGHETQLHNSMLSWMQSKHLERITEKLIAYTELSNA